MFHLSVLLICLPKNSDESMMVMGSPDMCMGFFLEGAVPEIYNEFLRFGCVMLEVVVKAPALAVRAACSQYRS